MEESDILRELTHKSKTVSDLIRYIKNITPNRVSIQPLFCLFEH